MTKKILILLALIIPATYAHSVEVKRCTNISYKKGHQYTLYVNKLLGINMHFEKPLYNGRFSNGAWVWSNVNTGSRLLKGAVSRDYLSIADTELKTSIAVTDDEDDVYFFTIKARKNSTETCVFVKKETFEDFEMGSGYRDHSMRGSDKNPKARKARINEKNLKQAQEVSDQKIARIRTDLLKNARHGYKWKSPYVLSVKDAENETYIAVTQKDTGVMTITAKDQGKTRIILPDFDPNSNVYKFFGVYDEITLRGGKRKIKIKRMEADG